MTRRKEKQQEQHSNQKIKIVEGKTNNQKEYIRSIIENEVIFCSGPSGCGKSFIAAGIAAEHLHRGDIEQIIVTRPIICTGKEIGALPGDLSEKINPYLMPMQENFRFFLGQAFYGLYANEKKIRYEPIEIMRGATFNNAYMILDEAQNCTFDQIKMFITRMGQNSKVLINGDTRQTDLKGKSGLWSCMNKLKNIEGISIVNLDNSDIQRHGMIGKILNALESDDYANL
jgi:phosphate starvation-inducible PhoH-like protein